MQLLHFLSALVLSGAVLADEGSLKHFLNEEELLEANAGQLRARRQAPVSSRSFARVRRQEMTGDADAGVPYAYDDDAEEGGPWEEWAGAGECSRTCGGGVIVETRKCDSPDASKCTGATKRYSSCNISPCPGGSRDFREEQCSEFNSVIFERNYYEWIPYLKAPRKCELNCMPRGERFYYRHAAKVIDGTPCDVGDGTSRVCVQGECLPVGCDNMLGSDMEEDKCRVCGGDGSNCNTVTGLLDSEDLVMGYNDLLLIPAGAKNILINEVKASNNYLSMRNMSNEYFINGNWRIDFPGDYPFAGTVFKYEKKIKGRKENQSPRAAKLLSMFAPEQISALGPTSEPIYVALLSQEANPGVEFEYSMTQGAVAEPPPEGEAYEWDRGAWGECDAICNGGFMTRQVFCLNTLSKERVPDYLCEVALRPASNETCNTDPCRPMWKVGEWSDCQAAGGNSTADAADDEGSGDGDAAAEGSSDATDAADSGECPAVQVRNVYCAQIVMKGVTGVADDSLCDAAGERPIAQRPCDDGADDDADDADDEAASDEGPRWHAGPWAGCSALCGKGTRLRPVQCYEVVNGTKALVDDEADCPAEVKPEAEEDCVGEEESCYVTDWVVSDWSGCKENCGLLKETRVALCSDANGLTVNDTNCDEEKLPTLEQECENEEETCDPSWVAFQWSRCSSTCQGISGIKTRPILCMGPGENGTFTQMEDEECDPELKYEGEMECEGEEECTGQWYASAFAACSATCGGGNARRKVFCIKDGEPVAPDQCPEDLKPFEEEECNKDVSCDPEADDEEGSGEGSGSGSGSGSGEEAEEEEEKEEKEKEKPIDTADGRCPHGVYGDDWIFGEGSPLGPKGNETEEEGSGEEDPEAITEEDLAGFEKRCKEPALEPCANSTFGCCPDEFFPAEGPFGQGCQEIKSCEEARFGCCLDSATEALGNDFEGCPESNCGDTLFDCCADGETVASGPDGEGCDENKLCDNGPFGCCPDGRTFAQGPKNQGCFSCPEEVWMCDSCLKTEFGCCIDLDNAALGPDFDGCPTKNGTGGGYKDCTLTENGCCPDGLTKAKGANFKGCQNATPCKDAQYGCCKDLFNPAHGPSEEGCCLTSKFGCCEDNITPAEGPDGEGCGCEFEEFGCCPDDVTAARGPDNAGCGCQVSKHGCCPDKFTPAEGDNLEGCPCHTYEFGCCPNGVSIARGPGQEGCSCKDTEFGCCPDRRTPADGPEAAGCGCAASKHGCCPDGEAEAAGPDFEDCDSLLPVPPPDVCGMPKERGPERNFTVRWFFDMEYGGCSRFWWGGTGGNQNNFANKELCNEVCVAPTGKDACALPAVAGPCEGFYPRFAYDADTKACAPFTYGGCLGNNNKFESMERCEATCVDDSELTKYLTDKCNQPIKPGPCQGNYTRWGYNQETETCEEFSFGGCRGNLNAFMTEGECVNSCQDKSASREMCLLPRSPGPCKDKLPKWYFDNSEKRCMPFYYGGCEGNGNRFDNLEDCQKGCPSEFLQTSVCELPEVQGPCRDFLERFRFDPAEGICKQFYYGGCEGNKNNFLTLDSCKSRCSADFSIPIEEEFKLEFCFLAIDEGKGDGKKASRWAYDSSTGTCKQFDYKGKKGNGNRFLTRQACELSCQPSQDPCTLPKEVGPCSGREEQFWYDSDKNDCFTFDWGGCQGNTNRFASRAFCEKACKRGGPGEKSLAEAVGPQGSLVDICNLPSDSGPGEAEIAAWFYDSESSKCTAFTYGGEEGNANRFTTQEQCERQCGAFKGEDVCTQPEMIGPCIGRFSKYFYDMNVGKCKEFTYGGCDGNGNRFSSLGECETVCLVQEELDVAGNNTEISRKSICSLEQEIGPCKAALQRWYFAEEKNTCESFIYSGCAGNRNRFKSFDICMGFCDVTVAAPPNLNGAGNAPSNSALYPASSAGGVQQTTEDPDMAYMPPPPPGGSGLAGPLGEEGGRNPPPQRPRPLQPGRPEEQNRPVQPMPTPERPEPLNPYDPEACRTIELQCAQAQCAYGILRYMDDRNGCESCYCNMPCHGHDCPAGTKCAVELYRETNGETAYRAVCRDETKDGVCPKLSRNEQASCAEDCAADSDCEGERKCCYNGCGKSCVEVVRDAGADYLPAAGDGSAPTKVKDPNAPWIDIRQPTVIANEGGLTELNVYASGNPQPDVYWRKGRKDIDTREGRFRIVNGGSLQIVGVTPEDEGQYTVIADNGRGVPAESVLTLAVDPAVPLAAKVIETEPEIYLSLGVPAVLHCLAFGSPRPVVTWWRNDKMLNNSNERLQEDSENFVLRFRQVGLKDLGPYSCQAYNGQGSPDSYTTVVKAVGPVAPSSDPNDRNFLQYVVDPPSSPPPSYGPVLPPSGIYRPTRPPGWDFNARPTTTARPRAGQGYLTVRIDLARSKFPLRQDIVIPCTVNSYSRPTVFWSKNGIRLRSDKKLQINRETNTLTIYDGAPSDSGTYVCEATNGYTTNQASALIRVEDVPVPRECRDNPYFANCKLIVRAQYCANQYYAKFCCASCTQAGQI